MYINDDQTDCIQFNLLLIPINTIFNYINIILINNYSINGNESNDDVNDDNNSTQ